MCDLREKQIVHIFVIIIIIPGPPPTDRKRQAISAQASWHRFESALLLALRYGSYMMHILVYTTRRRRWWRTSFSIFDVACRDGGNDKRWPCDYQFSRPLSYSLTLCHALYVHNATHIVPLPRRRTEPWFNENDIICLYILSRYL